VRIRHKIVPLPEIEIVAGHESLFLARDPDEKRVSTRPTAA
jgi:hypothetical protein